MTAALFCRAPRAADAGGVTLQDQIKIAIAENAQVTADIVLFNGFPNMVDMTKKTDDLAKREADSKHANYIKDHQSLRDFPPLVTTWVPPRRETNDYIDKMDDLSYTPAEPTIPTVFSEAYKARVGDFQAGALSVLQNNNHAAGDVRESQKKIQSLKAASDGSTVSIMGIPIPLTGGQDAYVSMLQSGGQVSTFLSQELSKLRVDISRQIAAEARFTLNERQEREDELLAFGQAVQAWTNSGRAGEGY
jgi:hypothetical protein